MQILRYFRYRSATLHIGPLSQPRYIRATRVQNSKQCQFCQDLTFLTLICSVEKFSIIFLVLEVLVAHVTYRATVTTTLHIGPCECKNRQTVSIWSRYDISYHNMQSRRVSIQILWYYSYRSRMLYIGLLSQPRYP